MIGGKHKNIKIDKVRLLTKKKQELIQTRRLWTKKKLKEKMKKKADPRRDVQTESFHRGQKLKIIPNAN